MENGDPSDAVRDSKQSYVSTHFSSCEVAQGERELMIEDSYVAARNLSVPVFQITFQLKVCTSLQKIRTGTSADLSFSDPHYRRRRCRDARPSPFAHAMGLPHPPWSWCSHHADWLAIR